MYKGKKYSLPVIKSLMKKIAKENLIPEEVKVAWVHSKVVYNFADRIAGVAAKNGYKINRPYLKSACFVHDIGRMITGSKGSRVLEKPVYHGLRGYRILKKSRYPECFARICLVHLNGTGLDSITNRKYGIFKNRNTLAKSVEEKIIAYADARTSFNKQKKKPEIKPFIWAYNRFNKYPRVGKRLKENHNFIQKITKGQIK
ncbi:MAG: HD domain-containing protein [Patescibacteria group bacterium]